MSTFRSIAVRVAVIGVAALGSVGVATAAPSGSGNAQDTVDELASDGYAVQLNGSPAGPLSSCSVTGVHGLPNDPVTIPAPKLLTTVYVDLDCMSNN